MDAPFPVGMMADIEKFFREVHPTLVPGRGVYDEVFATQHFFPLQRKREMARMLEIARRVSTVECQMCDGGKIKFFDPCGCKNTGRVGGPRTIMEIGADKGGGLYHWCQLPSIRNVIACEIRGTPYLSLFGEAFTRIKFQQLCDSHNNPAIYHFLNRNGSRRPIDVLFIDGDKAKMLQDFEEYAPLVSKGGVVFMHDVRDNGGPREAFAEVKRRGYRTEHIVDESEYAELRDAKTPWEGWLLHWAGRSCTVGVVYL